MDQRHSPYASEVILYRTRTEILTDQRIIAHGTMTPLRAISSVRVASTWYYIPLQAGRLVALPVGAVLLLSLLGLTGPAPGTMTRLAYLCLLLVAGGFVAFAPQIMPTHMIVLHTPAGRVRFLYSHDRGHLQSVVAEINDAIAQITKADQQ